ncbi:LuxR C-terminal-related transcriptional regulator [Methylobacterium planeticum]|uniref:Response regulator transcription factor n=1 Tax=Methylobacterium planeticum TaxID=2615211 RepID=A0A6N6MXM6_9HYPH|nr:response regulator transcription factor [Methylobacterium planeticum]KAB1075669.1 response regulator transcription factor [Methylobacterium planeticum]
MSRAVDVLVLDELREASPTLRASLEHMPVLHTIGESELKQDGAGTIALVFVDEARPADGSARLAGLKERWPALRTLVAFQALTGDALHGLLAAGADAFIARNASAYDVCTALLALADGQACLTGAPVPDAPEPGDVLGLTPREAEVLRFLSAGFSNKEVARRLSLSVRTVETHRLNLRRKTQTGRLKDLVSLARQLGLAPVVDAEPARRTGEGSARRPERDGAAHH